MQRPKYEKQEWRETALKGRMAESLVHDLLRESGNEVYRIGFEAILPGLTRIEQSFQRNTEVGEKLRAIPDFLVIDREGMPHLVEVKFRWNPAGHEDDVRKINRIKRLWVEALVVFVNCFEKPYFRLSRSSFLDGKNQLITEPLNTFATFNIPQELLDKFDRLVEKYLTPTLRK